MGRMNDLPLASLALLDSGQESTNTLHYVQTPDFVCKRDFMCKVL